MSEIEGRKKEILDRLFGLIRQRNDAGAKVEIERLQKQLQNMSGDRDKRIGSTWENVQKELFTPEEIAERHSRAKIAPIETVYNGYRFRSRLEARWAVFFDTCGIPYEYEKEGFECDNGERYLPDFYLPWFKAYVEIKPGNMGDRDRKKAMQKCMMPFNATDCIVLLCEGDPMDGKMTALCVGEKDEYYNVGWHDCYLAEGVCWEDDEGCEGCNSKHTISIVIGDENSRETSYMTSHLSSCCSEPGKFVTGFRSTFDHAKEKARQARFEYGDKGA